MNRMKVDAACCDGKLSAGCESQFKTDNATELQRWRGHWTLASQGQLAASGRQCTMGLDGGFFEVCCVNT